MALHHATSGEVIHLGAESGPQGTSALVKAPTFETIQLVVRAGEAIAAHRVEGAMTLYCIDGAVSIEIDGKPAEMAARDWLYLDPGVPHALRGRADSLLLLTILFDRPVGAANGGGQA